VEKKVEGFVFSVVEGKALLRKQLKLLAGRRRDQVPERRHEGGGKGCRKFMRKAMTRSDKTILLNLKM